jgi:hypothetical protein
LVPQGVAWAMAPLQQIVISFVFLYVETCDESFPGSR